ncbi:hypothetical protein M0811_01937 [Anaeramoeba ignava]|uniref:TLDc domain-containing protein n=1 Tax=Anaeramoeba ignava TaxID=1746090 RepID=A0A9Q0LD43_ANAIG|nr:hypothetical protein M0811_01937 [Anaeramoeba ignava]
MKAFLNKIQIKSNQNQIEKTNIQEIEKIKTIPNQFLSNFLFSQIEEKDQEINKIQKEKDQQINKKDQEINTKDQEIKKIQKEKDQQIDKIQKEKDQEINKKDQEIDKIQKEKDQEINKIQKEKDQEINKKDQEIKEMKPVYEKMKEEFEMISIFKESKIIQDIQYIYYLKGFISNDEVFKKMKLGFSVTRDNGWSNQTFHQKCDGKKETLVIIKSKNGCIFGGFTKDGFGSSGDFNPDKNSFIFTLKNPTNYTPSKFNPQSNSTVYRSSSWAMAFGSSGNVGIQDLSTRKGTSAGYSNGHYEIPNNFNSQTAPNFFTGSPNWEIEEVEVYFQ